MKRNVIVFVLNCCDNPSVSQTEHGPCVSHTKTNFFKAIFAHDLKLSVTWRVLCLKETGSGFQSDPSWGIKSQKSKSACVRQWLQNHLWAPCRPPHPSTFRADEIICTHIRTNWTNEAEFPQRIIIFSIEALSWCDAKRHNTSYCSINTKGFIPSQMCVNASYGSGLLIQGAVTLKVTPRNMPQYSLEKSYSKPCISLGATKWKLSLFKLPQNNSFNLVK